MLLKTYTCNGHYLKIDKDAVLFGAATHDIGKLMCKHEIYEEGNDHLELGYKLLKDLGYTERFACFAKNHETRVYGERTLEELLVSLSDVIWKGIRLNELEESVVQKIAERINKGFWEVYPKLDLIISTITSQSDERLIYQGE